VVPGLILCRYLFITRFSPVILQTNRNNMKKLHRLSLLLGLIPAILFSNQAFGSTVIINDSYTVTTSGTGFALNHGVNTGINPPTTRLTGTAATNLRYIQTVTNKPASVYDINSNRIRIQTNSSIGRFTLSADGTTPFDFSSSLGTAAASPSTPAVYDVTISMRNDSTTAARFSFGVATAEGDINNMDFAVQLFRATSGNNFYTIQKRFDQGSWNGTTTADATGDINDTMVLASANTVSTFINFMIRVTDAGAENGANYHSRVQVSTNSGSAWIYDTTTDSLLTNGFRFDGAGRYFLFDIAGNASATVYYDTFSVTWNSGPRTWNGAGANGNWNNATNWGGAVPGSGSALIFNGTTRQTNTNDLIGLTVPWLEFNNDGFVLSGNALTISSSITNTTGNNALNTPVTLGGAVKVQSDAGTLTLGGNWTDGTQNLTIDGAGNTTASGTINGTGSLTKNGGGTLQLSGISANTLSGSTLISAGTLSLAKTAGVNAIAGNLTVGDGVGGAGADVLRLDAANQIVDSSAVTVSASGSLNLNGFSETIASLSGASSASLVALGAGTLAVGDANSATFAGTISGTGDIVKQGSGTLTLSGANTYSGDTTISAGTLALGTGGSISTSAMLTIASGATFDVSAIPFNLGSGKTLARNATSGTGTINGSITFDSGANLSLLSDGPNKTVGNLSVTGNLTLNNNTIAINVSGGVLDTGSYTLVTYTGTRSGTFNLTPTITGSSLKAGLKAVILETTGLVSLKVVPIETNSIFRVMTYNIHSGVNPTNGTVDTTETANYILNNNVDLVSLNEVARFMPRSNGRDIIGELSQKTGMAYVFSNNDTSLTGDDQFGNAILSKFPILLKDHRLLPNINGNEQRGWLKAVVDVNGKYISFQSTHLDFHASDTERLMCGTNINAWLTNETVPAIICGDFNDTPNTSIYNLMDTKWDDTWLTAGDGSLGRTVPSPGYPNNLNARIDYIWKQHGTTITPTNAFVGYGIEASDHYPTLTDFILTSTTNHATGFSFPFTEGTGTNTFDAVGNLKGTFTAGGASWNTNSPSGQGGDFSVFFNGSRRITVQDPKQTIGTNGFNDDYTLQTWVKVAVNYAPSARAVMFQYERKPGFSFSINTNRTLHTTAFKVLDIPSTATLPNDGQWHHVAVVHTDGANMKFYIDSVLAATVAYTGGAGYRTDSTITIGADADGANPFTGYLDRVRFDNRSLTPAEFDFPAGPAQRSGDPLETWMAANGITDSNADTDGDGQSNLAEYIAHTNPTNATSVLRVTDVKQQANGQIGITWSSVGGTRYRVQSSDGLKGDFVDIVRDPASETDVAPSGQASTQSFTDNLAPTNGIRFYRIKVVP
jgi:autotransporter-associated beta strand protein